MKDLLKMEALQHCAVKDLDDLLRLSHYYAFGHDQPPSIRVREIASYHLTKQLPRYCLDYLDRILKE